MGDKKDRAARLRELAALSRHLAVTLSLRGDRERQLAAAEYFEDQAGRLEAEIEAAKALRSGPAEAPLLCEIGVYDLLF